MRNMITQRIWSFLEGLLTAFIGSKAAGEGKRDFPDWLKKKIEREFGPLDRDDLLKEFDRRGCSEEIQAVRFLLREANALHHGIITARDGRGRVIARITEDDVFRVLLLADPKNLQWRLDSLGKTLREEGVLEFIGELGLLKDDSIRQKARLIALEAVDGAVLADRKAAAALFRHSRRVRDSRWSHPHRIPVIGPFIDPIGYFRERWRRPREEAVPGMEREGTAPERRSHFQEGRQLPRRAETRSLPRGRERLAPGQEMKRLPPGERRNP